MQPERRRDPLTPSPPTYGGLPTAALDAVAGGLSKSELDRLATECGVTPTRLRQIAAAYELACDWWASQDDGWWPSG